ncbi:MAG: site-2 protease family protein, partial [Ilumatobacteraceae bacterium]
SACDAAGEWDRALELLRGDPGATAVSFCVRISACCARGDWETALDIHGELVATPGTRPTAYTYQTIMHALLEAGRWRKCLALYDELMASGTAVTTAAFVAAVRAKQPGDRVEVVIDRNGEIRSLIATLTVFPGSEETPEARAFFGVAGWSRDYVQLGVVEAMGRAAQDVVGTARDSVVGVFTVLNPINLADNLTSERANPLTRPSTVVGASQLGGEVGRDEGWKGVLLLLGAVNVFVGVFNMMPLLPFDGGHAAVAIYERLRSTRARRYHADVRKLAPVATAVVVLLVMLLVAGLYLDITQPLG